MKKKVLSMLVLLMTAVTGAWATEPKVYDSGEVEAYSLQKGDILLPGVTLTKGSYDIDVVAQGGRYFRDGQIQSGGTRFDIYPIVIGANGVINNKIAGAATTLDYTPITAEGEVGNAWEVTYVDAPSYRPGYKGITIGGIKYTPAAPAGYTVSLKEGTVDADKWTITPNPATAGTQVKATYSGTKRVKSVKAVKKAAAAAYTMAANAVAGDVGKLICTDGHIHANNADAGCTKSRVAMIAYVGSETGVDGYTHGLALALSDKGQMNWYTATGASGAAAHTPAAPTTTSSWMLPSRDQWNKMIDACKNVLGTKNNYQDLRDGFESVGGTNMSGVYWSSTENGGSAWHYNFGSGNWDWDFKDDDDFRVRACLAF